MQASSNQQVMSGLRVRRSFRDLENEHYALLREGSKKVSELETLVLAFQTISKKDPADFNSFFTIAGYHGEPFRGAGWGNAQWWGGYCHHGNILFPVWHRAYLWRLETALRESGVPGAENLVMPYWDEADEITKKEGVPTTFGRKTFPLSTGKGIANPLFSYTFQQAVWDNLGGDNGMYTKHVNYSTVRYPLSGLDRPSDGIRPSDRAHSTGFNDSIDELFPDPDKNFAILNENVKSWLSDSISIDPAGKKWTGVREKFHVCLQAPYYTVFSNTTSAAQYNETLFDVGGWKPEAAGDPQASKAIVSVESPHNSIHLACGGFDIPGQTNQSPIFGANGDMGENDTASFDPIFYFHHCFIDYTFWKWQQLHNQTDKLIIEPQFAKYPGTNTVDNQGPTPGVAGGTWLTLDSPLDPFTTKISHPNGTTPLTSHDVTNIETQLKYTYARGSLDPSLADGAERGPMSQPAPVLRVTGANRAASPGSFLMTVWADTSPDGNGKKDKLIGLEPVLSRWHVAGCANCQTHLNVKTFINLHALKGIETGTGDSATSLDSRVEVRVHTRKDMTGKDAHNLQWQKTKGRVGMIVRK